MYGFNLFSNKKSLIQVESYCRYGTPKVGYVYPEELTKITYKTLKF